MDVVEPNYYDADYYGVSGKGKKYVDSDGSIKEHSSYCGTGTWHGWISIIGAWQRMWNPANMLDIGCGPGSLINQAVEYGIDAQGVDYSPWCEANAYGKSKGRIRQADAANLPFEDAEFDLVVSTDLLEHIYRPHIQDVLKEAFRVAKPEGAVFHNICCSRPGDTIKIGGKVEQVEYALAEGESVPEIWQPLAVAGHVTVMPEIPFWQNQIDMAGNKQGWKRSCEMEEWFRELADPKAIQNWINILIYIKDCALDE